MMIIFGVISAIVAKLNRLLDQLNVSSRLKTVADIGAGVFVTASIAHLLMMIIFVVISAIVAKLNRLLDQLNVSSRLKTVADIGVGVFVTA